LVVPSVLQFTKSCSSDKATFFFLCGIVAITKRPLLLSTVLLGEGTQKIKVPTDIHFCAHLCFSYVIKNFKLDELNYGIDYLHIYYTLIK